ncbi:hypothetical protein ONZ45_g11507 [Pleurotus djamor]|nr:hypothetical protein ONZ45_g11507 [Pleurotus djamor]
MATIMASGATDVVVDATGTIHEAIKALTDGNSASKCVELVGGTTLFDSCQSLSPSGVISMIGCVSGEWVCKEFDPMTALAPSKHLTMFGSGTIDVTKSPMQWLVDAASRGEIQLNLDRVCKLEEAGAAHAYMESNAAAGKVSLMGVPDEQIFPHATGQAADTVAKHQEPQELIFYSGWFCPFVQRSWLTLEEKGIPYQYKEVNPYKKEQHFLDINPKGLVPAVEYKGKALYESLILCELFEEAFPDHKPNLLPLDPIGRAQARLAFDHISKTFVPAYFRLLISQTKDKQEAALEEVNEALRTFSAKIKGPYYFGEEFSLVDIAIAPWIVRDYIVIEHRGFKREVVGDVWKKYAELVEKRDSVLRTSSDKQHYTEIYGRYLRDEAQSAAAIAIRQGKAVP